MLDALTAKPVPSRSMTSDALVKSGTWQFGRTLRPLATMVAVGGMLLFVAGPGCADEGIGDPCTPEQEYNPEFLGFDQNEVSVESKSFQCRTRLCLVNHFRGRVSCPYGQDGDGKAREGAKGACTVPGSESPIVGAKVPNSDNFVDTSKKSRVEPQCIDRTADKAVYCSCRCADINGQRPSNQTFCDCPDGFSCERLVTSIGEGNEGLTGSYCIKKDTQFDSTTSCKQGDCDPSDSTRNCN